jgi:uncharacterized protein DUF2752
MPKQAEPAAAPQSPTAPGPAAGCRADASPAVVSPAPSPAASGPPDRYPAPQHAAGPPSGWPAGAHPGAAPGMPVGAPMIPVAPGVGGGHWPGRVPQSLIRRLLSPVGTLAAIAGAFTYVGLVDPNQAGHYPVCPLFALTGVYCPGCGGLRSAHAVAHGDLTGALHDNALAVVGYAVFAVVWVVWVARVSRGLPGRFSVKPFWWWSLGTVVLVFTLLRNLPFGSSLAP